MEHRHELLFEKKIPSLYILAWFLHDLHQKNERKTEISQTCFSKSN